MTSHEPDPVLDVPEADLLEQQAPVSPREADRETADETAGDLRTDTADEADRLEQLEVVPPENDDEYPHEV